MNRKANIKRLAIAVLLLTCSLFEIDLKAQCGAGTSVVLRTQTEVNNFISSNCTNFLGFLTIFDNNDGLDNITDLTPLSSLTFIGERLLIRANQSLTNLNGLQSLTTVNGANGMFISGNPVLADISGLSSLTTIGGDFTIQSNNMSSLNGLGNLSSIGGVLNIIDNDLLTDITSLSNLTSIDGYLTISNNDLLTSLSGLDNINAATIVSQNGAIDDLNIHDNPVLNECEVASICNAFNINTLTTNIMNNASGCAGNLAIITACAALPVEWLEQVVARVHGNSVELRFAIAVQVNNSHFEIEQSQDGRSYQTIGKIEGDGSTLLDTYYKYLDEHPLIGRNYYRVKQVDFDGNFAYSNIASAQFKVDEMRIYPNPVNEELTVIAKGKQAFHIYNQLGQIVRHVVVNEEINKIDLSELKAGIYYLRIGEKIEILIKE